MIATFLFILAGALVAAAILSRPDRYLFGAARRRESAWNPEPYLGEFVPIETPADRLTRENRVKLKRLLKKAERGW